MKKIKINDTRYEYTCYKLAEHILAGRKIDHDLQIKLEELHNAP